MTKIDNIFACLKANEGAWVPMPTLVAASGCYVIHSRVADLRKRYDGKFECKVERHHDGVETVTRSFYRYTPPSPTASSSPEVPL